MDNNQMKYVKTEKEKFIKVSDLVREIIRKLWVVIILAVLFAVLLGGYKYWHDSKAAQTIDQVIDTGEIEGSLSEEEITVVNNLMFIQENVDELQNYVDNSVLMQIDPNDESTVILQYYLEVPDSEASDMYAQDLMKSYESYINNGGLATAIVDQGYGLDVQYLGELLSYSREENSTTSVDETGNMIMSTSSTTFDLKIIGTDKEFVEQLADLIGNSLEFYKESAESSIGEHNLILVDRSYSEIVDSSLRTYKSDRINNITTLQDRINSIEEDFSEEQLDLLSQYKSIDVSAAEELDEGMVNSEQQTAVHISTRYVLLGVLIGVVIACILIIIVYILRGSINSANDIRDSYNLRILGEINESEKRRTHSGKRQKKAQLPFEQQERLLLANLLPACKEDGVKQILCSGSVNKGENSKIFAYLSSELGKEGIEIIFAPNPVYSADTLESLEDFDAVVFMEKIRESRYNELDEMLRVCLEHQMLILGVIITL